MISQQDLDIKSLGPAKVRSPLPFSTVEGDGIGNFVPDDARVLRDIEFRESQGYSGPLAFERAGAREQLFFDPAKTRAAIVTCGGLCPGLNNVIRGVFFELHSNYGVPEVLGIRYGFQGLNPREGKPPIRLTGDFVQEIHKTGGTVLGSSRGPQDVSVMVDFLADQKIDILICVGGDGTQRGAHAISEEVARRNLSISVVGIPKTIDNDIQYVDRTFGFETAIDKAVEHITGAHAEAVGVPNGVGLVKLMGRYAGFIAASAALASAQVNFALIPEVPFRLDGPGGLLESLYRRLDARGHAVIVVAEGAGQDLLPERHSGFDASGNPRLGDIGVFLREQIEAFLCERGMNAPLKYFDPSYHIRSVPANCSDSLLCNELASRAAHAAMAGKTDVLIGLRHNAYIHVPLSVATSGKRQVVPESDLWIGVLSATGQQKWGLE